MSVCLIGGKAERKSSSYEYGRRFLFWKFSMRRPFHVRKVSANLNFVEREKKIEAFWRENKIFEKSIEDRRDCKNYTFYDGPPTANGKPHIGHVLTRVIKDMIPRYRTMKGYKVDRKAGWDTHGLPVELEVEKSSGSTARSRSSNTESPLSSRNARRAFGNTRACGKNSPAPSAFGRIWSILM